MSYGAGYDQYNNNSQYGQPPQQQWGQDQQYGGQNYNQGGFGAPPPGPPPGAGQYGGGYDQSRNQYGAQSQSQGYYGDNAPQPGYGAPGADNEPPSNEDLPYPWVREWDETYKTIYYVNPSTTPPSTSWTHPGMAPGQVHPEQTETTREAESMYAEADGPDGGQPGERGFVTKAAVGFVGYKALKHLLANKNKPQQPQYGGGGYGQPQQQQSGGFGWGTAVTGAAAGAGGAFLLTKLFNGKKTNNYGHQMGPPPFMGAPARW